MWGVRGRAPSHPRPLVRSGVRPGPTTHWLWVRGLRAWGTVTNPTARALVSWLCALWGRHEGARGGRLLPGCGASGDGRSPTTDLLSVRACSRGPLPTSCGCGGCGRGDPSPTPQRALLRAGFARCGGGMRVPVGGASCLGVGRPGSGALPSPTTRPFEGAAGAHYPLAVGAGDAGLGTRQQPHKARSCKLALRAVGAARGRPGGAPLAWVWGVRGRALSHPDPSSVWACGWGPLPTGCECGGCGHGDPSATPQRALLRAGFARCWGGMRVPGGGASCLGVGFPGTGALPAPTSRLSGRAAGAHYPLAVGAAGAGLGTRHQPHSAPFASWLCALGGQHEGVRGEHLLPGCGTSGDGRSPTPNPSSVRARGRGPLPTRCGCGGVRAWGPVTNPTARALARCAGGMRMPRGGASSRAVGRPGTGALPPPTSRPFGRAPGAHYPLAVGAGGAGVGTCHQPHSGHSCELALRAVGAA